MFGKLFGGTFGLIVGGPVGALLGAAIGHNFDQQWWKKGVESDAASSSDRHQVPESFVPTAFALMGHIAKTDGRVSEAEISATRAIMQHLHLNSHQQRTAIDCFTAGKQADYRAEAAIDTLRQVCANRLTLLHQLLEMQLNVAYADGRLHPQTHARLLAIASQLGVSTLQFEALHTLFRAQFHRTRRQRHQNDNTETGRDHAHTHYDYHGPRQNTSIPSLGQAFATLGLTQNASADEIKLAYRRLLKRHHPDKLAASNASSAEIKNATDKTREITAAYERIRVFRGF